MTTQYLYAVVDNTTQYITTLEPTFITGTATTTVSNNSWSGTNTFNTSLPTSTVTPTLGTQFITKTFSDTTYATIAGSVSLSANNTFTGSNSLNGVTLTNAISVNMTPTSVSGSVAGNLLWTQTHNGTALKEVIIYLNGLSGSATFTFPTAFTRTPGIISSSILPPTLITALSTTSITVVGTISNGFLYLKGF